MNDIFDIGADYEIAKKMHRLCVAVGKVTTSKFNNQEWLFYNSKNQSCCIFCGEIIMNGKDNFNQHAISHLEKFEAWI
jgi:hypothetical protein